ncbi:glycoside hydrolase family 32 protein [Petrimonas sp.]|uniref:glycoside hydrolase family 32 protein n=1 Tax=Petrimonas sp. TaxID=2023866 RepID=UPI003F5120E9
MKKNPTILLLSLLLLITACKNNTTKTADAPFQEKYRPQVHFTPPAHWMNDPNGMVYHNGEYHFFYQHYPEKSVWGPMHWGHAISTDLVHWEHQPIAIYPDSLGYIFSGSAVVDSKNTSGLGTAQNPPLIAFFTYHDMEAERQERFHEIESQATAFSLDNGRTWTKYDRNPVVKNPGIRDFRDPKVMWHEESGQWVMSIASGQVIQFYTSPNCLDWTYASEFGEGVGNHGGVWECPDLFPLKVDGTDETRWVLIVNINPGGPAGGSATQYFVGDFDGKTFTSPQTDAQWMDYGKDNYAGVTWSNAPDGRRILVGWMNNWQYAGEKPAQIWSGAATFPRELGLVKTGDIYLLTSAPVREIEKLYGKSVSLQNREIVNTQTVFADADFAASPVEITLTFDVESNTRMDFPGKYGITLKNAAGEYYTIGYDNVDRFFYADRTNATSEEISEHFPSFQVLPFIVDGKTATWKLIVDMSSVELFAADGKVVITNVVYPSPAFDRIEIFAENGKINLVEARMTELKSIWK